MLPSLAEVRQNINRIDRELVRLMAERSKYVTEAGRFKPTLAAVIAPARVDLIIPKVRAGAEARTSTRPSPKQPFAP